MNRLAAAARLLQVDFDVQPNIRCLGDRAVPAHPAGLVGAGILIDDIGLIGCQQTARKPR